MANFDVKAFVSSDIVSRHHQIVNDLQLRILNYTLQRVTDGIVFDKANPFVIADIGCGNGEFTKQLITQFPPKVKSIIPYLIDPYGDKEFGIHTLSDMDFSSKFPSNHCDIIICKGVAHLFSNFFMFLRNCERILKPGGMLILVQMSDEIKFPWGPYAQKSFDVSTKAESYQWVAYDELQQNNFNKSSSSLIKHCVVTHTRHKHEQTISKKSWIQFIECKSWSTLQSLNNEQIKHCVNFVKNKYRNIDNIKIETKWIITQCIKQRHSKQCKL
eukprot:550110_1